MSTQNSDHSYLDRKYFIDEKVYNCPFCNRNNVKYTLKDSSYFDWNKDKACHVFFIRCSSCNNDSMHLSYKSYDAVFYGEGSIDSKIFYSVPTSFFVIDSRIPSIIRELVSEAEGCLKMNFLTGASACMRKAIYELTIKEKAQGENYESKIKFLKGNYPNTDPELFDILAHIKDMTSDKIHEQSWDKWNSDYLKLIIEALKTILYEIYVLPAKKNDRSSLVKDLLAKIKGDKKVVSGEEKT